LRNPDVPTALCAKKQRKNPIRSWPGFGAGIQIGVQAGKLTRNTSRKIQNKLEFYLKDQNTLVFFFWLFIEF
jgi:hypothetical protein